MKTNTDRILETEWSQEFESLFRDSVGTTSQESSSHLIEFLDYCQMAMVMSFHKYGSVADGYGPESERSAIGSIPARVLRYTDGGWRGDVEIKPGNTEWLTDVYNFAMIEFMFPRVPIHMVGPSGYTAQTMDSRPSRILSAVQRFSNSPLCPTELLIWIAGWAFEEYCDPQVSGAHFMGTDNQSPGRLNLEEDGEHFLSEHHN